MITILIALDYTLNVFIKENQDKEWNFLPMGLVMCQLTKPTRRLSVAHKCSNLRTEKTVHKHETSNQGGDKFNCCRTRGQGSLDLQNNMPEYLEIDK